MQETARFPWPICEAGCWNMHTNICPCPKSPSHVGFYIPAPWETHMGWGKNPWFPEVSNVDFPLNPLNIRIWEMPLIVHRNRTVGKWFKEETHIGTWQVQSCWDPRHESGPWVWTQGFNCLYCYVLSFREVPTLDFQRMCFFFVGRMVRITHSHSRGYLKKWWIPKSPWLFFTLCHGRLCWMMNWGCPNDLGNPWNPPFGQCSGRSLAMLKAEAKTRRECDAATRSGDMSNQNWIWI